MVVSTVWSVSCLLFFYPRCPRAQPFVKVGAREPRPYGVGTGADGRILLNDQPHFTTTVRKVVIAYKWLIVYAA